jgi:hypothetical protein
MAGARFGRLRHIAVNEKISGPVALAPCASVTADRQCRDCYEPDFCAIRRVLMVEAQRTTEVLNRHRLSEFHSVLPKASV